MSQNHNRYGIYPQQITHQILPSSGQRYSGPRLSTKTPSNPDGLHFRMNGTAKGAHSLDGLLEQQAECEQNAIDYSLEEYDALSKNIEDVYPFLKSANLQNSSKKYLTQILVEYRYRANIVDRAFIVKEFFNQSDFNSVPAIIDQFDVYEKTIDASVARLIIDYWKVQNPQEIGILVAKINVEIENQLKGFDDKTFLHQVNTTRAKKSLPELQATTQRQKDFLSQNISKLSELKKIMSELENTLTKLGEKEITLQVKNNNSSEKNTTHTINSALENDLDTLFAEFGLESKEGNQVVFSVKDPQLNLESNELLQKIVAMTKLSPEELKNQLVAITNSTNNLRVFFSVHLLRSILPAGQSDSEKWKRFVHDYFVLTRSFAKNWRYAISSSQNITDLSTRKEQLNQLKNLGFTIDLQEVEQAYNQVLLGLKEREVRWTEMTLPAASYGVS